MASWREGGVLWDEAWTAWCALATLGADHAEIRKIGRRGREIAVELGAAPVVAHFDAWLGAAAGTGDDGVDDAGVTAAPTRDAEVGEPA